MFHIPVGDGKPAVNWALSLFDIIIIDEVSQVSLRIMEQVIHSVDMLPKSTLLICVGDRYQTQPIETVDGKNVTGTNVYKTRIREIFEEHFYLIDHVRAKDPALIEFLALIRDCRPTTRQIER